MKYYLLLFPFFLWCWAQPYENLEDFNNALQEKGKKLKTFHATLIQSKKMKFLSKPLVSEGKVWFKQKDWVRWEIQKPEPSTLWLSQQKMWCYFPEFQQCEFYDLTQFPLFHKKTDPSSLFLGLFQDLKTLENTYKITFTTQESSYLLDIQPLDKKLQKQFKKIHIFFDLETLNPQKLHFFYSNGTEIQTLFSLIEINAPLKDELFKPQFPEGTLLIDKTPKEESE
jgi:outer membrane lipoprotein-sorting protein